MMGRDGLRFADEGEATLALFAIAEEQQWTWYETYLLAKRNGCRPDCLSKENEAKVGSGQPRATPHVL